MAEVRGRTAIGPAEVSAGQVLPFGLLGKSHQGIGSRGDLRTAGSLFLRKFAISRTVKRTAFEEQHRQQVASHRQRYPREQQRSPYTPGCSITSFHLETETRKPRILTRSPYDQT
jgi:hypothetical protein